MEKSKWYTLNMKRLDPPSHAHGPQTFPNYSSLRPMHFQQTRQMFQTLCDEVPRVVRESDGKMAKFSANGTVDTDRLPESIASY